MKDFKDGQNLRIFYKRCWFFMLDWVCYFFILLLGGGFCCEALKAIVGNI
jgi:hypothetical protein